MNKTKELKIDSILWATPSKLVNPLNFNPDKISIKKENHVNNIKVHYLRYESGGFCLKIDDLDGYFDFSHDLGHLSLLFDDDDDDDDDDGDDDDDDDKQDKYCQVWKEILKTINGGHFKIFKCKQIRLVDDDLPIGGMFKINSITIVIK